MDNKISFRPVQGTEEKIMSLPNKEGNLYFATDTKKIYLDTGTQKLPMGGNSGIYYGTKDFGKDIPDDQTEFEFNPNDLEINQNGDSLTIPNIDDMILNIPDGCFYRVISIETNEGTEEVIIKTEKLTIAGSGGGGGSFAGKFTLTALTPKFVTILFGTEYSIGFNAIAIDADGVATGNGYYELYVNNIKKISGATAYQGDNYVAISSYLGQASSHTVKLVVYMDNGTGNYISRSQTFTITTTQMELLWEYKDTNLNYIDSDFIIQYSLSGSGSDISKTVTLVIDDLYQVVLQKDFSTTNIQSYTISRTDLVAFNITHGAHKFELKGKAIISGMEVETKSIVHYVIFAERGNNSYIISVGLKNNELVQYDTTYIPIIIYGAENVNGSATITLRESGVIKSTIENAKNLTIYQWAYTPSIAGSYPLTIQCGTSENTFVVNVKSVNIDNEEVKEYAFKFKASDFANNTAIQRWNDNGISASFSERFDWINGGLKFNENDAIHGQFVRVKAGSQMTINYPLFFKDAADYGKSFKFVFKASNCRNYDAKVLTCLHNNNTEGIQMTAQNALFKSLSYQINAQYCEDSYIEFELDITKKDSQGKKNYITLWLDGVPCGVAVYYNTSSEFTGPENTYITIGSEDCDIDVYLIKVYEKSLTNKEHLQNFIADAPTSEEMIARYTRNDIFDERGEISPTRLAVKNPDCLVHVYEIPRMTTLKKDPVDKCIYTQYHGSDQACLHAENVTIKVQGTSSEAYVISAANLDSKFKEGFTDTINQQHIDKWSMDGGTAIPVNYFCTKANVASCENANNAMNQEWYNLFQPYKTVLSFKEPNSRDTMQFTNGVTFILDKNPIFVISSENTKDQNKKNNIFGDTPGYINSPYPKMYSLANMGNSKKNVEVFHDTSEGSKECCVEVPDNQQPKQHMVEKMDPNTDYNKFDGQNYYFEFRYPDGNENASDEMKRGWSNFVNWMAESNPQPKYELHKISSQEEFSKLSGKVYIMNVNENKYDIVESYQEGNTEYYTETVHIYGYDNLKLAQPEEYGSYTFRGFIDKNQINPSTGKPWQNDYTPLIRGVTETTFAGTYTHDTYERRMAKMLNECENHIVMDSVVYHYLFIETHCMIDNVAKNTFWSSEDLEHWYLNKDYDNDTADGNDNEGKLTRTYGMEPLDMLNENVHVFNATNSVWLHFIDGLTDTQNAMYSKLEGTKKTYMGKEVTVWNKDDYLNALKEWQDRIPEACYIEDYYRKYFRPHELYNEDLYLEMLTGGKKQHQRRQFETYQEIYMGTKHYGNIVTSDRMQIRSDAKNLNIDSYRLPVEVYSDCYLYFDVGSTLSPRKRVKRNTIIELECPQSNLTDAVVRISPVSSLTKIGDVNGYNLSSLLPKTIETPGARKLRELVIGTENDIENKLLSQITVNSNILLEKLYAGRLTYTDANTGQGFGLNLNGCTSLKEVNALGSNISSVILPDGCPIKTLELQAPTALTLSNLYNLETLTIRDTSRLGTLNFNNIDSENISTKDIVKQCLNKENNKVFKNYELLNINWNLDDSNDINTIDGQNPSINILDSLQPLNTTPATSLTGNINVKESAYNGRYSINMYNKYAKKDVYPDVNINFEGQSAKLYTVRILDGNGEKLWERKIELGSNVNNDFLSDGPQGAFTIESIFKSSTPQYNYTFTKRWKKYRSLDMTGESEILDSEMPYLENIDSDVVLMPEFKEELRQYTVKFFSNIVNDSLDITNPTVTKVYPFGTMLKDIAPKEIPYKENPSSFSLYEAYDFKGYSLINGSLVIAPSTYSLSNDQSFYAVFEKENDIRNIVHEDWFDFTQTSYDRDNTYSSDEYAAYFPNQNDRVPYPSKLNVGGCSISIKQGLILQGKVTLPAIGTYINKNGKKETGPVIAIKEHFGDGQKITHLFCEKENSNILEIGTDAFSGGQTYFNNFYGDNVSYFKYFDFTPNTVRFVDIKAFYNCVLDAKIYSDPKYGLSSNMYYVGADAFNKAFSSLNDSNVTLYIPGEVRYADSGSFNNQYILRGWTLQLGTSDKPSMFSFEWYNNNRPTETQYVPFSQNKSGLIQQGYENVIIYSNKYTSIDNTIGNRQLFQYFIREGDDINNYWQANEISWTFYKGGANK